MSASDAPSPQIEAPQVTGAHTTTTGLSVRSGPSRLPALTGLRLVAAFVVFGFHLGTGHVMDTGWVGRVMSWTFGQGAVGVSFFFILSGFVLTWSARTGDTARTFWQRRAAKIYPNHIVTWFIALAAAVAKGATVTAAIAAPNLLLLQAWSPDHTIYFGMNTVSWSLSCEAFFYALFFAIHRLIVRLPGRMLWAATIAAMASIWLVPVVVSLAPQPYHYWAIWVFPVARLPEFLVGMLLARVVREGRWPAIAVWPVAVLTGAIYVASRYLPEDFRIVAGTAVPLALLVASVAAKDASGKHSWLSSRGAVFLGEISFAFYLLHQLVLRTVAWRLGVDHSMAAETLMALVMLAMTVAASWLLYRFVEIPGMRRFGPSRGRHSAERTVADGRAAAQPVLEPEGQLP